MNNKYKIIITGCAAFLFANAAQAQAWQIEGAGQVVHQPSDSGFKAASNAVGFSAGIGYGYYLNQNFSLNIGLSYLKNDLDYATSFVRNAYDQQDSEGDRFEFRYTADNYYETVQMQSLRIPLTVQYETQGVVRWYMRTGILYGMQLGKSKYQLDWQNLKTSGYYEQWDAELNGPLFAGFGDQGNQRHEGKVKLQNSFSWIVETGIKQQLSSKDDLYIGFFFEMGLNNIRPNNAAESQAVEYTNNTDQPLVYNSILNQQQFSDKKLTTHIFGIKLRYAVDFSKK